MSPIPWRLAGRRLAGVCSVSVVLPCLLSPILFARAEETVETRTGEARASEQLFATSEQVFFETLGNSLRSWGSEEDDGPGLPAPRHVQRKYGLLQKGSSSRGGGSASGETHHKAAGRMAMNTPGQQAAIMLKALDLLDGAATKLIQSDPAKLENPEDSPFAASADPSMARTELQRTMTATRQIASNFNKLLLLAERVQKEEEKLEKEKVPKKVDPQEQALEDRLNSQLQFLKRQNKMLKADTAQSSSFIERLRAEDVEACHPEVAEEMVRKKILGQGLIKMADQKLQIEKLSKENPVLAKKVEDLREKDLAEEDLVKKEEDNSTSSTTSPGGKRSGAASAVVVDYLDKSKNASSLPKMSLAQMAALVQKLERENAGLESDIKGLRFSLNNALPPEMRRKQIDREIEQVHEHVVKVKEAFLKKEESEEDKLKGMNETKLGIQEALQTMKDRNSDLVGENKQLHSYLAKAKETEQALTWSMANMTDEVDRQLRDQDHLLTSIARARGLEPKARIVPDVPPAASASSPAKQKAKQPEFTPEELAAAARWRPKVMPDSEKESMKNVDTYLTDAVLHPEKKVRQILGEFPSSEQEAPTAPSKVHPASDTYPEQWAQHALLKAGAFADWFNSRTASKFGPH